MPELGSKISLISKADIRYEGRLFTVDPNECTIALASVRSFGTEDRETQFPIVAQNQVYDYILFRGSDIKDIRVCNPTPVPNDPAIMQMHLPPQPGSGMAALGQQAPFQPPHFPPMGGGMMPGQQNPGHFGPFGGMGGGGAGGMQGAPNAGLMAAMLEFIGGGSRSTTPHSLISRKSPSNDMGVQAGSGGNNNQSRDGGKNRNNSQNSGSQQQNNNNNQMRNRRDSGRNQEGGDNSKSLQQQGGQQRNNNMGQTRYQRNPQQQQQQGQEMGNQMGWVNRQQQQPGGGMMRGQNQMRGQNNMRGQRGGRMNTRTMLNPQFRQQMNPNMKPRIPGKPIKFESDFDFEQANSKFEELFSKLKVGDSANPDAKIDQPEVNGEVLEKKEKDDSGNETGAGEQEPEEGDEAPSVGYDKTKSFFDNISCEAQTDRKGKPRVDWRQERKLNSETFGVSSTRRGGGPGGYRGRGGNNYNNNAGGYFHRGNSHHQGGYRSNNMGYRNNNYRRHNPRMNNGTNPASTGVPPNAKQAVAGPSSGEGSGSQSAAPQAVAAQ